MKQNKKRVFITLLVCGLSTLCKGNGSALSHGVENQTFSGYIVKEAKRLGVSIPLSEKIYQGLIEIAEKF